MRFFYNLGYILNLVYGINGRKTKRKYGARLEPFFESMLPHLNTGTIRVKTGEL
jgi:hypothetical protein